MYKKLLIVVLTINMLLLTACWGEGGKMVIYNDDKKAETRLEQVIAAINANDKASLRLMFSEYALDEAKNLDECIEALFEFIQGDIESWELRGGSSPKSSNYGHVVKQLDFWYYINTDKCQYLLTLLEYIEHTDNPKKIGLYSLMVTNVEDENAQFNDPGVFVLSGNA